MMRLQDRKTNTQRAANIAYVGILSALAMIFTYIESFFPSLIFPGFKLGLANIVVTLAVYKLGILPASTIMLCKVLLSSLLFGNIQSIFFSVCGSGLAFASLIFSKYILRNKVSFIGISIISASLHNSGQVIAAVVMYRQASIFRYLAPLLIASVIYGGIVGILLNLFDGRISFGSGKSKTPQNEAKTGKPTLRVSAAALCVCMLLPMLTACTKTDGDTDEITFFAMDTYMSVKIYAVKDANSILSECTDIVADIEKAASATIKDSFVSKFNESDEGSDIGSVCAEIVQKSLEISAMTHGAFDITVRPLTLLWNVSGGGPVPGDEDIAKALENVGYEKLSLDGTYLYKTDKNVQIDLGGVAKGYALSKVCEYIRSEFEKLEDKNGTYAIVNFGGNVGIVGEKKNGEDFSVAIKDPDNTNDYSGIMNIKNGYIAVTGGYERFFEENGKNYCHVIDPKSGKTVDNIKMSVVYSENAMVGDALSTALFVMGKDKAQKLYSENPDLFESIIMTADSDFLTDGARKIYKEKQ